MALKQQEQAFSPDLVMKRSLLKQRIMFHFRDRNDISDPILQVASRSESLLYELASENSSPTSAVAPPPPPVPQQFRQHQCQSLVPHDLVLIHDSVAHQELCFHRPVHGTEIDPEGYTLRGRRSNREPRKRVFHDFTDGYSDSELGDCDLVATADDNDNVGSDGDSGSAEHGDGEDGSTTAVGDDDDEEYNDGDDDDGDFDVYEDAYNSKRTSATKRRKVTFKDEEKTEELPYSCPHCPRRFAKKIYLDGHLVAHSTDRFYQCPHCKKSFGKDFHLKSHITLRHAQGSKQPVQAKEGASGVALYSYQCSKCQAMFSSLDQLSLHIKDSHTTMPPAVDDTLATAERGEESVQGASEQSVNSFPAPTPVAKSTGVGSEVDGKPVQCNICNRRFSREMYLTSHMVSHLSHKPFKCLHCKKQFGQEHHMRSHIKHKHFQESQGSTQREKIVAVRPSELSPDSFACPCCSRCFAKGFHLKSHIYQKHKNNPVAEEMMKSLSTKKSRNATAIFEGVAKLTDVLVESSSSDDDEDVPLTIDLQDGAGGEDTNSRVSSLSLGNSTTAGATVPLDSEPVQQEAGLNGRSCLWGEVLLQSGQVLARDVEDPGALWSPQTPISTPSSSVTSGDPLSFPMTVPTTQYMSTVPERDISPNELTREVPSSDDITSVARLSPRCDIILVDSMDPVSEVNGSLDKPHRLQLVVSLRRDRISCGQASSGVNSSALLSGATTPSPSGHNSLERSARHNNLELSARHNNLEQSARHNNLDESSSTTLPGASSCSRGRKRSSESSTDSVDRLYPCEHCGMCFTRSSSLGSHKYQKHRSESEWERRKSGDRKPPLQVPSQPQPSNLQRGVMSAVPYHSTSDRGLSVAWSDHSPSFTNTSATSDDVFLNGTVSSSTPHPSSRYRQSEGNCPDPKKICLETVSCHPSSGPPSYKCSAGSSGSPSSTLQPQPPSSPRPHVCEECGKAFAKANHLGSHVYQRHGSNSRSRSSSGDQPLHSPVPNSRAGSHSSHLASHFQTLSQSQSHSQPKHEQNPPPHCDVLSTFQTHSNSGAQFSGPNDLGPMWRGQSEQRGVHSPLQGTTLEARRGSTVVQGAAAFHGGLTRPGAVAPEQGAHTSQWSTAADTSRPNNLCDGSLQGATTLNAFPMMVQDPYMVPMVGGVPGVDYAARHTYIPATAGVFAAGWNPINITSNAHQMLYSGHPVSAAVVNSSFMKVEEALPMNQAVKEPVFTNHSPMWSSISSGTSASSLILEGEPSLINSTFSHPVQLARKPAGTVEETIPGKTVSKKKVVRPKELSCPLCPRQFACSSHLNSHMPSHDTERPHHCTQCPKQFATAHHLRSHVTHSHVKKTQRAEQGRLCHTCWCQHCGKGFTQKNYLANHLQSHKSCSSSSSSTSTSTAPAPAGTPSPALTLGSEQQQQPEPSPAVFEEGGEEKEVAVVTSLLSSPSTDAVSSASAPVQSAHSPLSVEHRHSTVDSPGLQKPSELVGFVQSMCSRSQIGAITSEESLTPPVAMPPVAMTTSPNVNATAVPHAANLCSPSLSYNSDLSQNLSMTLPSWNPIDDPKVKSDVPVSKPSKRRAPRCSAPPPTAGSGPVVTAHSPLETSSKTRVSKPSTLSSPGLDYTCPYCSRDFNTRAQIAMHIVAHESGNLTNQKSSPSTAATASAKCRVCGEGFPNSRSLRLHTQQEHPVAAGDGDGSSNVSAPVRSRPHKCDQCSSTFTMKNHLDSHLYLKHVPDSSVGIERVGDLYPCPYCKRTFDYFYRAKSHIYHTHVNRNKSVKP